MADLSNEKKRLQSARLPYSDTLREVKSKTLGL